MTETTDLARFIQATPMVNTHEHQHVEEYWINEGPDVLADLFSIYVGEDLCAAGASIEAIMRALDAKDPDVAGRWSGIADAWQHCQHTGYGRNVSFIAKELYAIEEITAQSLQAAAPINARLRQPGERLRLLRDVANLDHIQIDNMKLYHDMNDFAPEFFLEDISWFDFANGTIDIEAIHTATGITVQDFSSLQQVIETIFAKQGPSSIAVKSQHAYERTLAWQPRTDAEAESVLQKQISGEALSEADQLCLGDWCLAQGVQRAAKHHLPFKIHTGLLAGVGRSIDWNRIRPTNLVPLLAAYPDTQFVLMHMGYPYQNELTAIAKQFANVYVDMCWAWSINPYAAADFFRQLLHGVPINKVFAFGGDNFFPTGTVAYSAQARQWLTYALQVEVNEGFLSEAQAITVAGKVMHDNQYACFDVAGVRHALAERHQPRE